MNRTDEDLRAWLEALSRLQGLLIAENYRAGVLANLKVLLSHAEQVTAFPLDEREEPAQVFKA
jgi:hypothetical protein